MQRLMGNKGIDAIPPYGYGGMASIQVDILTALRIWGYALKGLKLLGGPDTIALDGIYVLPYGV